MSQVERDAEELALFLTRLKNEFAEKLYKSDSLGNKITDKSGRPVNPWPQDARRVIWCVRRAFYIYPGEEDNWLTRFYGEINRSGIFRIEHTLSEDRRWHFYHAEDENTGCAMGSTIVMGVLARRVGEETNLPVVCLRTIEALERVDKEVAAAIMIASYIPKNRGLSLALPAGSMLFGKRM